MEALFIRYRAELALVTNFTFNDKNLTISNFNGSAYAHYFSRSAQSTRRMNVYRLTNNGDVFWNSNRHILPCGQFRYDKAMFSYQCSVVFRGQDSFFWCRFYGDAWVVHFCKWSYLGCFCLYGGRGESSLCRRVTSCLRLRPTPWMCSCNTSLCYDC